MGLAAHLSSNPAARSGVYRGDRRGARPKHQNTKATPVSTRDNSTNMDPMELAVGAMEAQSEGEQPSYIKVAEEYNVSKHTLARRCKGIQAPVHAKSLNQQRLNPQQGQELIRSWQKRRLSKTIITVYSTVQQISYAELTRTVI